jgi:hypothetical protein
VVLALAACARDVTDPDDPALTIAEVILAGDDGSFTFSHTDHWHGAPTVRAGSSAGFTMHFTKTRRSADDHDAPAVEGWFSLGEHPDHNVRVVIEDTTIASWSGDRIRGSLHGRREGASRLTIVVLRDATTIYEAPPLNFRVQAASASAMNH